jgi:hypothetical protein
MKGMKDVKKELPVVAPSRPDSDRCPPCRAISLRRQQSQLVEGEKVRFLEI